MTGKRGRPKGSPNKGTELGRKTIFKTMSISGRPEEMDALKNLAKARNKSVSKLVFEALHENRL
ncbi:hypothetical protein [uncultured Treponema sp.]|uniref:hypothetical protein n=1 Tax=uncultured Treponema sp. TaxID=162155 RepID=UPI0025D066EB|nr:hypothetical protein [uncultured Treponema sp.]